MTGDIENVIFEISKEKYKDIVSHVEKPLGILHKDDNEVYLVVLTDPLSIASEYQQESNVVLKESYPEILRQRLEHPGMILFDLIEAGYEGTILLDGPLYIVSNSTKIMLRQGYHYYIVYGKRHKVEYNLTIGGVEQ